ncbi:MAG: outer membrane lipoprotein carrier protein LolA [Methylococcales bacterium]
MNQYFSHLSSFFKTCCLIFSIYIISNLSYAEDSVSALMQKMQAKTAVKIAYQEVRTLELMDQPWYGSGFMYSIAPDLMIREQLKPQRLLMGIKGDQLFYFDPENHLHHQAEITEDNPLSLNVAVFKALITADEALLKRMYLIEFSHQSERWVMKLKPKQNSESGFSIVVSGLPEQAADTIIVKQADGDLSEFLLQQKGVGEQVKKTATRLYKELVGE